MPRALTRARLPRHRCEGELAPRSQVGHRPPLSISSPTTESQVQSGGVITARRTPDKPPRPVTPFPGGQLRGRHSRASAGAIACPLSFPHPPGSPGTPAGSTCVSELALLLFLLAIEIAPGGGGSSSGGGTDGGSGRPIDTSRPGKGKGELQLRCPARRRRTSHVPARARHDDAGAEGAGRSGGRGGQVTDGRRAAELRAGGGFRSHRLVWCWTRADRGPVV